MGARCRRPNRGRAERRQQPAPIERGSCHRTPSPTAEPDYSAPRHRSEKRIGTDQIDRLLRHRRRKRRQRLRALHHRQHLLVERGDAGAPRDAARQDPAVAIDAEAQRRHALLVPRFGAGRITLVLLQPRQHEVAPARDGGAARGAAGARRLRVSPPCCCSERGAAVVRGAGVCCWTGFVSAFWVSGFSSGFFSTAFGSGNGSVTSRAAPRSSASARRPRARPAPAASASAAPPPCPGPARDRPAMPARPAAARARRSPPAKPPSPPAPASGISR